MFGRGSVSLRACFRGRGGGARVSPGGLPAWGRRAGGGGARDEALRFRLLYLGENKGYTLLETKQRKRGHAPEIET